MYLSGVVPSNPVHQESLRKAGVGVMTTPNIAYSVERMREFPFWAADTGLYSQAGERAFDLERYLSWLDTRPRERCLFATAPDKVGDAVETLRRSWPVMPLVRSLGFPVAFVAQDGIMDAPWESFDVLFIGGSTHFKYSDDVRRLVGLAKEHSKPVHMGRVNSYARFKWARELGCDSADGTYLAFGPDVLMPKVLSWVTSHRQLTLEDIA